VFQSINVYLVFHLVLIGFPFVIPAVHAVAGRAVSALRALVAERDTAPGYVPRALRVEAELA
jgi:hypothetical protein